MKGPAVLTAAEVLALSTRYLADHGSSTARLDSQILAAHVLGIRKLDLYLAPDRPLTSAERDRLRDLMVRRGRGEPVAYLTGTKEFFGLEFKVGPAVLIPRPETESIVDAAVNWLESRFVEGSPSSVLDMGTGSGAIACAIAVKLPSTRVTAVDISAPALEIAIQNAAKLGVSDRITFVHSDLFEAIPDGERFDLIVSNPPYIAESESGIVDPGAAFFEPLNALYSGPEGMDCTRALLRSARHRLNPGGRLVIEVGSPAQQALVEIDLRGYFSECVSIKDPAGFVRGYSCG